jgi:hypothetical protein
MNTIFCAIVVWLTCVLAVYGHTQSELYSSNHEPLLPAPLPAAYKDYQVLPGTISPDQQYGLIYPKRSRLYELRHYGLFLAALKPFRVLSQLPLGNSNLAENARCYFESNWAKDSSAVVMIAGSRWGPEKVSVVALGKGRVVERAELTAAVRRMVQPDFQKAHASPYNEYYDFVFTGSYSWDLDQAGHVRIDCECTTDPKNIDPHRWTVHFIGSWDIGRSRLQQKKLVRVPFTSSAS